MPSEAAPRPTRTPRTPTRRTREGLAGACAAASLGMPSISSRQCSLYLGFKCKQCSATHAMIAHSSARYGLRRTETAGLGRRRVSSGDRLASIRLAYERSRYVDPRPAPASEPCGRCEGWPPRSLNVYGAARSMRQTTFLCSDSHSNCSEEEKACNRKGRFGHFFSSPCMWIANMQNEQPREFELGDGEEDSNSKGGKGGESRKVGSPRLGRGASGGGARAESNAHPRVMCRGPEALAAHNLEVRLLRRRLVGCRSWA